MCKNMETWNNRVHFARCEHFDIIRTLSVQYKKSLSSSALDKMTDSGKSERYYFFLIFFHILKKVNIFFIPHLCIIVSFFYHVNLSPHCLCCFTQRGIHSFNIYFYCHVVSTLFSIVGEGWARDRENLYKEVVMSPCKTLGIVRNIIKSNKAIYINQYITFI